MTYRQLLLRYAAKNPFLIIISVIFSSSSALFNGISTTLLVPIVLEILGEGTLNLEEGPPLLQKLLSLFDGFSGETRLLVMVVSVLLLIILKDIMNYAKSLTGGYLHRSLANGMRLEGIQMLLEVDLDFYSKSKIGDLSNRLGQEINRTAGAIRSVINLLSIVITILTFVWILIALSWQITVVATVLLGIVAVCNQYFIKRSRKYGQNLANRARDYSNKLLEILTGVRLIKTVSNEEKEYEQIKELVLEREQAEFLTQVNSELIDPINEITGILIVLSIIILGRYLFAEQLQAAATVLLTYLVVLFRLLPNVSTLNKVRSQFANNAPSAEIVADFLRRDDKPFMPKGEAPYLKLAQGIGFEQVSFAYPGQEQLVLKEVDLWIPKGKTIALVGASGAGKSTIADLLPRFYDPVNGCITVDGKDIRKFDLKQLRGAMGVVSQDTFLFNNTVRYNLTYGVEKATESELVDAAKRANAYEFITRLPKGFETEIGDRGVMLSGGQRQRMAIARALLRNPDILILDEATSALDTVSERLVQQAIDELCRDRTTLVIAHRLSTVQSAHQIAVLDQGQVVEVGNHQELLNRDGYYARLYSMQFGDQDGLSSEAELRSFYQSQTNLSYQARTSLSSMLGSLRLVADGFVDTTEEQVNLLEESYISAMRLLKSIEAFEQNACKLVTK